MLKTLKKIGAGIVLTVMAFIGLCFVTVLPAQASEPKTIGICHYDEGGKGELGKYTFQVVSKASILKVSGETGGHGDHEEDIIPPFSLNDGGANGGEYPGRNWTPENQSLYGNGSGCAPTNNILTPVLPVAPIQTCANPNPTFTVPAQPAGITATSAADDKGNYTVSYQLPANTVYNTYAFPEGFVNPVTVSTVDNRPLDEFWDATKGECNLPNMGAGSIKSEHILWAGGLIFAGLLLTTVARIGRRNA
jgi:hypothetical protein